MFHLQFCKGNGPFRDQKMVKNDTFQDALGTHLDHICGLYLDHVWTFLTLFEPTNGQIYKGKGPFRDQTMAQNDLNMTLFGTILGPFWDHFGTILTIFDARCVPASRPILAREVYKAGFGC